MDPSVPDMKKRKLGEDEDEPRGREKEEQEEEEEEEEEEERLGCFPSSSPPPTSTSSSLPLSRDEIKSLLEPLSKEQLVNLLADAGCQYPAIADDIRAIASKDPAHRKLFVRGLAWETSSEALRDVFEKYGEIEEGAVIIDKATGKSRGFGFITYKHMDSAQRALKEPSKTIDGRLAVCNLAISGTYSPAGSSDQAQRKLFIGGLSYETTTETLINIFSQYGEIEEGSVAYDKAANKSRGFAFMTYKTVEGARKALADPNKTIEGRNVIIKLAMEGQKEKPQPQVTTSHSGGAFVPQGQSRYTANPNLGVYARTSIQQNSGQSVGLGGYPASLASAYASSTSYGSLGGNQYGSSGGGSGGTYGSSSHPHYGGGLGGGMGGGLSSQSAQPGLHSSSTLSGMLPGYYGSGP